MNLEVKVASSVKKKGKKSSQCKKICWSGRVYRQVQTDQKTSLL